MSDTFLRRSTVEQLVGLSKASIYRKMKEGTFPKPRRIGENAVRWPASSIEKWMAERPPAQPDENS